MQRNSSQPLIWCISIVLCLAFCSAADIAAAQSSHPYCEQYRQYCQQTGEPYCQQYQQYCSRGGGGRGGRFRVESFVWRQFIGVGGYTGSQSGWALSPGVTLGPVVARRLNRRGAEFRFRGVQFVPEIGFLGLIPFSTLSEEADRYRMNMAGIIGLRWLRGFDRVSLGAGGHLLVGGFNIESPAEDLEIWRFSTGLRGSVEVAFGNGIIGFELAYCLLTEFMEEHIHSFLLYFYFD
jgi:hypothetical protein